MMRLSNRQTDHADFPHPSFPEELRLSWRLVSFFGLLQVGVDDYRVFQILHRRRIEEKVRERDVEDSALVEPAPADIVADDDLAK